MKLKLKLTVSSEIRKNLVTSASNAISRIKRVKEQRVCLIALSKTLEREKKKGTSAGMRGFEHGQVYGLRARRSRPGLRSANAGPLYRRHSASPSHVSSV